jgi:hypothetical protein
VPGLGSPALISVNGRGRHPCRGPEVSLLDRLALRRPTLRCLAYHRPEACNLCEAATRALQHCKRFLDLAQVKTVIAMTAL